MANWDLVRLLYRSDFDAFARFVFRELHQSLLDDNWHLELFGAHLGACVERQARRLLINAPPQTGKSLWTAVAYAVFELCRRPDSEVLVLTGGREAAQRLRRLAETLIRSPRFRSVFPKLAIVTTTRGLQIRGLGQLRYATWGEAHVGGADIVVIDEPLPSYQAQDEAALTALNDFFDAEIAPSMGRADTVVVVATKRLNVNDLTGHLLRRRADWVHLKFQAVAEHDETWVLPSGRTLMRKRGEALHLARQTAEQLQAVLCDIEACKFRALYQQDPPQVWREYCVQFMPLRVSRGWKPEMDFPDNCGFFRFSETKCLLRRLFGSDEPPKEELFELTPEQWEEAAIIHQARLVAQSQL